MGEHLMKALGLFIDNGFVTEVDVSSVGLTTFRKQLKKELEKYDVKFESLAFEIKGQSMYFFYNVKLFPVYSEMEKFITQYMEQRS